MAQRRSVLRELMSNRSVAALGTLQGEEPYVSMVPFAVAATGTSIIIHTSHLAAHTQNMSRNNRVSLLVTEAESPTKSPQSLARVTIQGRAREVGNHEAENRELRQAYVQRFPAAEAMFEFADFRLFSIDIASARLVAGFAQAMTLSPEDVAAALDASIDGA